MYLAIKGIQFSIFLILEATTRSKKNLFVISPAMDKTFVSILYFYLDINLSCIKEAIQSYSLPRNRRENLYHSILSRFNQKWIQNVDHCSKSTQILSKNG